jgi:hypothetical protein
LLTRCFAGVVVVVTGGGGGGGGGGAGAAVVVVVGRTGRGVVEDVLSSKTPYTAAAAATMARMAASVHLLRFDLGKRIAHAG